MRLMGVSAFRKNMGQVIQELDGSGPLVLMVRSRPEAVVITWDEYAAWCDLSRAEEAS